MIAGINRVSYLDYPGEISTIIFTGGCNFRCGWCHNAGIVNPVDKLSIDKIINDLLDNQKNINHIVISGGEPTIYKQQLIDLIIQLKSHGFLIKLDTNGSNPEIVKQLLNNNLLDYIAMDIKNIFSEYAETVGVNIDIEKIKETINLIENSGIEYQFRTTVNGLQHNQNKVDEIRTYLRDADKLKIQKYKYNGNQLKDIDYQTIEIK